jgi:hypothetical protein
MCLVGDNGGVEDKAAPDGIWRTQMPRLRRWESVGLGVFVSLAIVGPTFLSEETWRGAPLIDRGGLLWLVPSFVMAIGFFLGGTIAGYRRQGLKLALLQGLLVAAVTIGLAFVGDLGRRYLLGEGLQLRVLEYWVAAVAVALLVGGLGAAAGRYRAIRAWKRRHVEFG